MRFARRNGRRGISELVGTVLTTAITLIAGFAVFGFVNGQAGISELTYGQRAQNVLQSLSENFVPFDMNFTNPAKVSIWFYNTGTTTFYPVRVSIYNATKNLNLLYNATKVVDQNNVAGCHPSSSSYLSRPLYNPTGSSQPSNVYGVAPGAISYITLTLPCSLAFRSAGTVYFILVTGLYGNTVAFSQFG